MAKKINKANVIQTDPDFTEVEIDEDADSLGGSAFMRAVADAVELPNVPSEVTAEVAKDILDKIFEALAEFPLHSMSKSKLEKAVASKSAIDDGKELTEDRKNTIMKEKNEINALTQKLFDKYKAEPVLTDEDRESLLLALNKIRTRVFSMPIKMDGTPMSNDEFLAWQKQYIKA